MKIVGTGSSFRVYGNDLKTFEKLPAGTYTLEFSMMGGFYLEEHAEIEITEKMYGDHEAKVEKLKNAWVRSDRNFGVIMYGDKGIGKSLTAKKIDIEFVKMGVPVVLVQHYYAGFSSFIESIEQEIVLIFDEFDKTFGEVKAVEGAQSPQTELLTLMDGFGTGKKLFIFTCNDIRKINDYIINRPGRAHYRFQFGYPSAPEVEEYMKDNIPEEMYPEIRKVVEFAAKVKLNYDCLRAIAFELSGGCTFEQAIEDMNVPKADSDSYNMFIEFHNGFTVKKKGVYIDFFDDDDDDDDYRETFYLRDDEGRTIISLEFSKDDMAFSYELGGYIVPVNKLTKTYHHERRTPGEGGKLPEPSEFEKKVMAAEEAGFDYLLIKRKVTKKSYAA